MKKYLTAGIIGLGVAMMLTACGKQTSTETTEKETASESVSETVSASETAETEAQVDDKKYAYEYDVASMVKLGDYKGLKYTIADTSVSDDDVNTRIDSVLQNHATTEQITDRAAKDGDIVNIDFEGLIDGEAFEGNKSPEGGYEMQIGAGRMIEGFEEGVIDVKPGETTTLNLKFPDDYGNKSVAGKDVVFTITLNYIEGDQIVPELNDDFVKGLKIQNVETVDAYRTYIKNQLKEEKESEAEKAKQNELFAEAFKNAEVTEVPDEMAEQYTQEYRDYYEQYAAMFGMEMKDFLEQYMQKSEDDFNKEAEDYGKEAASNMLVLAAIAKNEGVDINDDYYNAHVSAYLEQAGVDDVTTLESNYGKKYLKQVMMNEAVISILKDNAVGVEASETETETETESK